MELNTKKTKEDDNDQAKSESRGGIRRRIPLKMFGKKFSSKRLLVSSKVWMHTIPTEDCDILLTLPATISDTTIMWLLSRLHSRTPQISVYFRHHSNSGIYGLYMTTSYENLLQGAEELAIRKPLKSEFGGGMKEFVLEDQECFEGVTEERSFLTSQERQSIVYHMLNNLRATEGEELDGVRFLEGQPIVPRLVSKDVVSGVFPLHCQRDLLYLRETWVHSFLSPQPLDKITEYFGVKIGMYFGYLGHYTKWLVFPAFLGLALWLLQGTSQWWEDVCWVVYSIFNVLWATLYIINWKRTGASLAYRWGTLDKKDELLKDPRPLFKGDLRKSPITGHLEPFYPAWKRNIFRYCVSMPIIILCLLFVFYIMLLIFQLQEWVNWAIVAGDVPTFLRFGPKVLMAVAIAFMDDLYKQLAIFLNNKENHRLPETHETNLVIKLVLFQFVNSFLSLFYIAFYLRDMDRLRDTLATLLITRQILGNMKEVLIPLFKWKGRLYSVGYKMAGQMSNRTLDREVKKVASAYRRKLTTKSAASSTHKEEEEEDKDEGSEKPGRPDETGLLAKGKEEEEVSGSGGQTSLDHQGALTQAEVESAMTVYDNAFEDYLEMCIQFGYVTLFSSAFPLAAVCALLNNLIEIRSDAFKLCCTYQRPFGIRVEDIGIWQDVLQVMVVIAVIVNSALIGMGGLMHRIVPGLSDMLTVLLIVVVEHLILLVKSALEYAIPDVPYEVASQMAKVEFQRREALKRLETQGGSERSPRLRYLDGPGQSSHSSDSPVPLSRSGAHTLTPSLTVSRDSHQSLIGHRPQNFNSNQNQEDRQRGGNPWGPSERGQGSPGSHNPRGTSFSDSPQGARRLPPVPLDDRFRNPFESELQQIFRQPRDVPQIYRKSPDSSTTPGEPSRGRPIREGSSEKNCPGYLSRSSPGSLCSRVRSPDTDAVSYYRKTSQPQLSAQSEAASSLPREASSRPGESFSPPRGTVSPQRRAASPPKGVTSPERRLSSPLREAGVFSASSVRRRDGQPVSPTAVGLLAGESSVDHPAGITKAVKK